MITLSEQKYIFSKTAAANIVGLKPRDIDYITEIGNGAIRIFRSDGKSQLTKRIDYLKYFWSSRQERSHGIKVFPDHEDKTLWYAQSARDEHEHYLVEVTPARLTCTCKDWEVQHTDLDVKTPCCKHCYAVLHSLGFTSMKNYLEDF